MSTHWHCTDRFFFLISRPFSSGIILFSLNFHRLCAWWMILSFSSILNLFYHILSTPSSKLGLLKLFHPINIWYNVLKESKIHFGQDKEQRMNKIEKRKLFRLLKRFGLIFAKYCTFWLWKQRILLQKFHFFHYFLCNNIKCNDEGWSEGFHLITAMYFSIKLYFSIFAVFFRGGYNVWLVGLLLFLFSEIDSIVYTRVELQSHGMQLCWMLFLSGQFSLYRKNTD